MAMELGNVVAEDKSKSDGVDIVWKLGMLFEGCH
jgi:hypothetical protein